MSVSSGNQGPDITAKISDSSIAVGRIVQGDTTNTTNTDMVMKAATAETTKPLGITLEAGAAANDEVAVRTSGIALCDVDGSGTALDIVRPSVQRPAGRVWRPLRRMPRNSGRSVLRWPHHRPMAT